MLQSRLDTAVDHEFSYWEKRGPVVLSLLGEKMKILLDPLVYAFGLSICLRMICSHELAVDTKFLV